MSEQNNLPIPSNPDDLMKILDSLTASMEPWQRVLHQKLSPSKDYTDNQLLSMISEARFYVQLAMPVICHYVSSTKTNIVRSNEFTAYAQYNTVTEDVEMVFGADMFVSLENDKQRAFLMAHEMLHVILRHGPMHHQLKLRNAEIDDKILHHAMDYYINNICSGFYLDKEGEIKVNDKISKNLEPVKGGLFDKSFTGLSVMQIYEKLKERGEQGSGDGEGDGEGMCLELTDDMIKQMSEKVQRKVDQTVQAAKAMGNQHGDPILDEIMKSYKPVVDLKSRLHAMMVAAGDENETYEQPNNRYSGEADIIMPTRYGCKINLFLGYDTSGSMSQQDLEQVSQVILDVARQYESWQITLASCDTRTHIIGTYDGDSMEDMSKINFEVVHRGGTDMAPLAAYARDMVNDGEEISACIIVTDGYIPESVDNYFSPFIDNLVIVTSSGNTALTLNNADVVQIDGNDAIV